MYVSTRNDTASVYHLCVRNENSSYYIFLIPEISEDLNNQSELAGFFLNLRRVSDYILFTIVASPEY